MAADFDFKLAKAHFRGNGWQGLAALAIVLFARAAMFASVAVSASSGGIWLVQLLKHLV